MAAAQRPMQTISVSDKWVPGEGVVRRSLVAKDGLIGTYDEKITTLPEMFEHVSKQYAKNRCFGTRSVIKDNQPGPYEFVNFEEINKRRINVAAALVGLGLKSGEPVGIYSSNRSEWLLVDLACSSISLPSVALYDTLGKDAVEFIVNHAEISVAFCASKQLKTFLSVVTNCKSMKTIVALDDPTDEQKQQAQDANVTLLTMKEFEQKGVDAPVDLSTHAPPSASTLYTIMYTSGTTGNPKGVMLTHANLIAELTGVRYHLKGKEGLSDADCHMSYLPLAHSFERAVCYTILSYAGSIGFSRGIIAELVNDIAALAPTFLVGAPRVWTRMHDRVQAQIQSAGWLKKTLFQTGYDWKKTYLSRGESTPMLDSVIFGGPRSKLGGKVKWILSGSAPLDPKLGEWLRIVFCCNVIEGYGLTENLAGACISDINETKLGHVGRPLCCTEVKLLDVPEMNYTSRQDPPTGEIMLRGHNVFKGYYKDETKTKEALEEDGWFHTGDIGRWNADGTLSIIDRKKNIFKLAQGEYVAVEYLEGVYIRSQYVGQIWVYGNSFKRYLLAVVVPDFDMLKMWCDNNGLKGVDEKTLCSNEKVEKMIFDDIVAEGKKAKLHGFELIKGIHLTSEPFSVDNDLTTPTFKLKRPQLLKRFQSEIDGLYNKIGE